MVISKLPQVSAGGLHPPSRALLWQWSRHHRSCMPHSHYSSFGKRLVCPAGGSGGRNMAISKQPQVPALPCDGTPVHSSEKWPPAPAADGRPGMLSRMSVVGTCPTTSTGRPRPPPSEAKSRHKSKFAPAGWPKSATTWSWHDPRPPIESWQRLVCTLRSGGVSQAQGHRLGCCDCRKRG